MSNVCMSWKYVYIYIYGLICLKRTQDSNKSDGNYFGIPGAYKNRCFLKVHLQQKMFSENCPHKKLHYFEVALTKISILQASPLQKNIIQKSPLHKYILFKSHPYKNRYQIESTITQIDIIQKWPLQK